MPAGDLHFLGFGVARKFNYFQAVPQGRVNGFQPVRGGNKKHARQIKWQVKIMIGEGAVLLGVENLEQCRGRIAPKIRPDFVELIQQDDRIAAFHAAQGLDDAAGHCAHIGPAMAPDFRLIPHSTQRNAGKFSAESIRQAFTKGRLTHARRSHQAQDRPLDLLAALDHGDEFQQPVLDLFQAEMLFVQDLFRRLQIENILGVLFPRQAQDPVQIVAHHAVFGGCRRCLGQPFQLLFRCPARFRRHDATLHPLPDGLDFVAVGFAVTQFALDGAELLAQEKIALGLGNGAGHVTLNF